MDIAKTPKYKLLTKKIKREKIKTDFNEIENDSNIQESNISNLKETLLPKVKRKYNKKSKVNSDIAVTSNLEQEQVKSIINYYFIIGYCNKAGTTRSIYERRL